MHRKIRAIGAVILVTLWASLTGFAWFGPRQETSHAERRPLAQMPDISIETLFSGKFMSEFEDFTLDQFPLRDSFRQLKSLFHYYVMNQSDNNQIYIADGYAAEMEYPLNESSVNHALGQFQKVYNKYLKDSGSRVFATVVPDKSYYLAEDNGYLAMDYSRLFDMVSKGLSWASYVDITDCLRTEDYYYTDTHWRQEKLLAAARKLSRQMGLSLPKAEDFTVTPLERPFYGVYYGQAALPMDPETMYIMESELLQDCTVYNYVNGKYAQVYDMDKLSSKDLYEVYLSGSQSLLRIENPYGIAGKELIVFRDSFGSSLVPLLVQDYAGVTLVDIRYISVEVLGNYIDFQNRDVLFMYSSLVLNKNLI